MAQHCLTSPELDMALTSIMRPVVDYKRDRIGTNGSLGAKPSRITYMAHAKGWVMCRHPGCTPFAVMEKEWLSFPFYEKPETE